MTQIVRTDSYLEINNGEDFLRLISLSDEIIRCIGSKNPPRLERYLNAM